MYKVTLLSSSDESYSSVSIQEHFALQVGDFVISYDEDEVEFKRHEVYQYGSCCYRVQDNIYFYFYLHCRITHLKQTLLKIFMEKHTIHLLKHTFWPKF